MKGNTAVTFPFSRRDRASSICQKIYVLPGFQGKHIGSYLFRQAVSYIRSIHPAPCQMRLNVNRYNTRAVEFYNRMGMKEVERGDFHIGHGYYMTDYIMGLDIA